METRANYIAIGIFTMVVFAIAFGFIYWLERYNDRGEAVSLDLILPADAGGLKIGSGVLFNGLRVGTVRAVSYRPDDPQNVYAIIEVRSDTPLREDTAVGIEVQPLTGLSNVKLVGGSPDKPPLLEQEVVPALRAKSSSLQATIDKAGEAVETATSVLKKVDQLLDESGGSISTTLTNVETFSAALANNADGIDELLKNVAETSTALNSLGATIAGVSDDVEALVKAIDPVKVSSTIDNVEQVTAAFAKNSSEVDEIVGGARETVENLASLSENLKTASTAFAGGTLARTLSNVEGLTSDLDGTLNKVDKVLEAVNPDQLKQTFENLNGFTGRLNSAGNEIDTIIKNAKTATEDVTAFTKSLAGNEDNINKIIADASVISSRLIETSDVITKLIGRVDGLVEADGRGFITEATDAATAIRKIAESFEARADEISSGLQRFSTRGLSDIETLINESRQAVSRIDGVVRNLENNPARFITGGSQVPEYRPRR